MGRHRVIFEHGLYLPGKGNYRLTFEATMPFVPEKKSRIDIGKVAWVVMDVAYSVDKEAIVVDLGTACCRSEEEMRERMEGLRKDGWSGTLVDLEEREARALERVAAKRARAT